MVRRFGGASRKRQGGHLVRTSRAEDIEAGRYGSGSGSNLQLMAHGARHQPRAIQARQNQPDIVGFVINLDFKRGFLATLIQFLLPVLSITSHEFNK
ncbi:hypothetical protein Ddc_12137 [Ditylenchus destructor]|nr:hypothetical protein Ddc_12137 [Ditylenchus destructor]